MSKKISIILVLCAILVLVSPVSADWTERINGQASAVTTYGEFYLNISAWDGGDGTFGGQGEYYYPGNGNKFHLKVEEVCSGVNGLGQPYIVAIGPISEQEGTEMGFTYASFSITDRGELGDGIRVLAYTSHDAALNYCHNAVAMGLVAANVTEGDFTIRTK